MPVERRSANRWTNHFDEIQAAIRPSREIYPIKDISKWGMAIEYSPVADEPFGSEAIDIIAIDCYRFYLPNIACKTVYDISTLMHDRSFRGGAMRIRGLKFVNLNKKHEETLNTLLNRCSDHPA